MTGSDVAQRRTASEVAPAARTTVPPLNAPPSTRTLPERPPLADKAGAPVLVKLPPPLAVRLAQLLWILSFAVGASAVVYLFIIRKAQLPEILELVRSVDATRAGGTYDTAADIVFWCIFGGAVTVLFVQITFLVAFSNRRPNTRWWLLGTLFLQTIVLLFARELVAMGDRGRPVELLLLIQLGLALLGLGFSVLGSALRWTARKHDVRRGPAT